MNTRGPEVVVVVNPTKVDGDVLTEAGLLRFAVQPDCLVVRAGRDSV